MKILLVDDESKKIKRLYAVIKSINGLDDDSIEHVLDLKSAKEKMIKTRYSLVVLDLKIDECIGVEDESEIAGLEFIDEVLETDAILTPKDIIILTEHEKLQDKCIEMGKNLEYIVLRYDEQSLEWESVIKNKIRYNIKYEESVNLYSDVSNADAAIICVVDNEMDALKEAFRDIEFYRINFNNDSTDYYIGDIIKEKKM